MSLKMRLNSILKAFLLFFITLFSITFVRAQGDTCKPFDFNLAPEFKVGQNIFAFGSADFNGDGFADIFTPSQNGQNFSIMFGDGAGGFAPAQVFSTGTQSTNIFTAGDVNNDGKTDLIGVSSGSNFNTNKLVALLNNGQGSFLAPVITDLPNTVIEFYHLKVADFNGDGKADVAGLTRTNLNFFLGNGQGGFSLATTLQWNGNGNKIVTGNFNNDSITDLAVTGGDFGNPWELGIALGTPGGTFSFNNRYTLSGQPSGIDVGEFNRDGITDIVITANYPYANSTPQTRFAEFWLGGGGGNFTAGTKVQYPVLTSGVVTGDYNNDSIQDIAVNLGSIIAVGYGAGNGTVRNNDFFLSPGATSMLGTDANQDNKKDLLVLRGGSRFENDFLRWHRYCRGGL
jgi:hypothetical protein